MKLTVRDSILRSSRFHIMGILNVTPDSFFDGGLHNKFTKALEHTSFMINAGATIIDIGGESTRPGSTEVSVDEELSRVIPIVEAIAQRFEIWISVDTSKPEIIRESAQVGAHIINDVRSFSNPGAIEALAKTNLLACLVHMHGTPKTMQKMPRYTDVLTEIDHFFVEQIIRCKHAGISKERLLIDPGFGFGKSLSHNYELLSHLSDFNHFNIPILVGMSRKSMIWKLTNTESSKCLNGSLACAVIAAMQGANIIRVHDVKETMEVIRVVAATLLARKDKCYE